MSSREVLRKQNDVVISKSSELRLPQLFRSFAMTIKKTFSAILKYKGAQGGKPVGARAGDIR